MYSYETFPLEIMILSVMPTRKILTNSSINFDISKGKNCKDRQDSTLAKKLAFNGFHSFN